MSAINANADLFLNVTNPFGAKDTSAIVFTDAGEDYPLHAEVRHVFELGLMSPLSDDVFGVDEQATLGELAYALGALVFEEPLPAGDALDALASYGVLPNEPADTVLTHGACDNSLVNLLALLGVEAQPDPESEITHTPMTRGELAEQLSLLAQMFGY